MKRGGFEEWKDGPTTSRVLITVHDTRFGLTVLSSGGPSSDGGPPSPIIRLEVGVPEVVRARPPARARDRPRHPCRPRHGSADFGMTDRVPGDHVSSVLVPCPGVYVRVPTGPCPVTFDSSTVVPLLTPIPSEPHRGPRGEGRRGPCHVSTVIRGLHPVSTPEFTVLHSVSTPRVSAP